MSFLVAPSPSPLFRGLTLGLQFALSVVLPLLLFVLGGRVLDRMTGRSPLFLLLGLAVSLGLSVLLIGRQVREVVKESKP